MEIMGVREKLNAHEEVGSDDRTRTCNLVINSHPLYH